MDNEYSLEVRKIFKGAEAEMLALEHPYVGTEHLLLSLLKNSGSIKEMLKRHGLTYDYFLAELTDVVGNTAKKSEGVIYTALLKRIIKYAGMKNKEKGITPESLLQAIIDEGEGIAMRILISMDIDIDSIYEELTIFDKKYNNKLEVFNIGKNLQETVDMDDLLIGRDEEINLIIETLVRKNKNNPLLVGEAGVGKSAIIEELARRINNRKVPTPLLDKIIVSLEMSSLVAGTKYRGEFEEKLGRIIKEIEENPNIILFIDEIHTMTNAGGAEGAINASDILKPYLARGKVKIIGATTTHEYNKFILKDKALTRRFELIKVSEPNEDETKNILNKLIPIYELYYNIKITKKNIEEIVDLTSKYIIDRHNPDKSIDLLDSICAKISIESSKEKKIEHLNQSLAKIIKQKENKVVENKFDEALILRQKELNIKQAITNTKGSKIYITSNDIKEMIYRKLNIPIIANKDKLYDSLCEYLKSKIIGQKEQLELITSTIKNHEEGSPLSILITGSTGVGKTKTVKEIAKYLKMPLVRLDMSEYNSDITVSKLIGATAGYVGYDDENIFDKIKINPHSCILIDELEKAHPNVLNLFLTILDEGFVTNAKGEKIDFKNTFIFLTSNAKLNKNIGFLKNNGTYTNNFSKEFLARIKETINYNDVDEEMLEEYLRKNGYDDLSILKDYDYRNLGFRGLEKHLKNNSKKVGS